MLSGMTVYLTKAAIQNSVVEIHDLVVLNARCVDFKELDRLHQK
jgi:hypothetical protein